MPRHSWVVLSLLLASPVRAAAQSATPPASDGAGGGTAIAVVVFAAIALIAGLGWAIDRRRRRADRAVSLEAQLSEALLREPGLGLRVTPKVELRGWARSVARVELVGPVPSEQSRAAALRIAGQETARSGLAFDLQDRMTISRVA
jgi:hypothetical protein